jgi:hypothetical protein
MTESNNKKIKEKDKAIEELHREVDVLKNKCQRMISELHEKNAMLKETEDRLREESIEK